MKQPNENGKKPGWFRTCANFILNPRLLLCFGIGWLITNGWAYLLFGIGIYYNIGWMSRVSGAYLTFLWLPFTPEKIVTCAIAIFLLRLLFPNDEKTLAILMAWFPKAKEKARHRRSPQKKGDNTDEKNNE